MNSWWEIQAGVFIITIAAQPVREVALDSPHHEGGLAANRWEGQQGVRVGAMEEA